MAPAPETGVEVVVPGRRRQRACWVARQGVAWEADLDVAGGVPGAWEVVVVLHWFLGSSPRLVRSFCLAGFWPGPGTREEEEGGGVCWGRDELCL